MKNYYFGYREELLNEKQIKFATEIEYVYITDMTAFECFADGLDMETLGIKKINTFYYWCMDYGLWVELDEETDCFFLDRLKQSISKFTTKKIIKMN